MKSQIIIDVGIPMNIKSKKGSVTLEAVISISISLMIFIALFGALLSVYLNERAQWIAMNVRNEMCALSMPFQGQNKAFESTINEFAIVQITKLTFEKELKKAKLNQLIVVNTIKANGNLNGTLEVEFTYDLNIFSPVKTGILVIPITAAAFSDGVDFKSTTVYITNYGEKYHKGDCYYLKKSKIAIDLEKAISEGYDGCKICYKNFPGKELIVQ